jgi:hypothetical protein
VTATSELGKGSTFTAVLPVAVQPARVEPTSPEMKRLA